MTSLFCVQLSFCLGSLSFSSKTLTQLGRPLSSPCPPRGVRPLVTCNPEDSSRLSTRPTPVCPIKGVEGRLSSLSSLLGQSLWLPGGSWRGTGLCVLCLCSLKGCGWFSPEGDRGHEKSPRRALILNFGPVTPLLHTSASD